MDPRQFVKKSNVSIQTEPTKKGGLKIGKFHPGMYNVLVNKKFSTTEKRVDLQYILKQKPKGHAQIAPGLTLDLNEIKGYFGRFQTGVIHTSNFGLKGDLKKDFFSVRVKVLTALFLEPVLAVEDQLEGRQWTRSFFIELQITDQNWRTRGTWGNRHVRVNIRRHQGRHRNRGVSKVPQLVGVTSNTGGFSGTPDQFLDWVVVRQSDLLGRTGGGQGVRTSVLNLFDQVFVTLLRKSSAFFSVKVDVVTPHLERVEVSAVDTGQVKVNSDFVVLQGNQWQGQSWVSVKEEDQWQVNLFVINSRRSHLTVVQLLGFVHVQFCVQSPPSLVVFVDSLTTDGQFSGLDRTLSDPPGKSVGGVGASRRSGTELLSIRCDPSGGRTRDLGVAFVTLKSLRDT